MNLTLILFLIGILGFVLNRKNIILMLISIEIMLLAITFLILVSSLNIDDIIGQTYAIYIIVVAGAESAIGLGILVAFYRLILSHIYLKFVNCSYSRINCSYSRFNCSRFGPIPIHTSNRPRPTYRRYYSTNSSNLQGRVTTLNPNFVSGLIDAEGSFVVTILKRSDYKLGWSVQARLQIKLHEMDRDLLLSVQEFFGGIGYISKINNRSAVEFRVSKISDIVNVIIPHLEKYSLKTNKKTDFSIFSSIIKLLLENKHKTPEGLQEIINYRAGLNWGLPENLKISFPLTQPISSRGDLRPWGSGGRTLFNKADGKLTESISPEWLAGFCTGESNFFIAISNPKGGGTSTWLRFSIGQDSRDIALLESVVNFFCCGKVYRIKNREVCEFVVTRIDDIINIIIPFFDKHFILGSKHMNYIKFKEAATLIKNKQHLNEEGIYRIKELKNSMNKTIKTQVD